MITRIAVAAVLVVALIGGLYFSGLIGPSHGYPKEGALCAMGIIAGFCVVALAILEVGRRGGNTKDKQ